MKKRLIITAKDVAQITGYSVSHSRSILRKIRKKHKKRSWQWVSVTEFAEEMGLDASEIQNTLD